MRVRPSVFSGTMRLLRRPSFFDRLSVVADCAVIPCPESCLFLAQVQERTHAPHPIGRLLTGLPVFAGVQTRTLLDLPSSQGTPVCSCHVLRPRSGLGTWPGAALRCCPRHYDDEDPDVMISFVAQSHGFGTGCLRFVPSLLMTMQNSLPVVANLFRVGLFTH